MALVLVTPPGSQPVTLDDAKLQCRIPEADTTHDVLLAKYVENAAETIERATGSRLGEHTMRLELDGFPSGEIDLCVYPVISITSVEYDDTANVTQGLNVDADYWQDLGGMYPKLKPVTSWPATMAGKPASVRITMQVGFTTDLPPDIRHAVLIRVAEYFQNNAESSQQESFAAETTVKALLSTYCRVGL